MPGRIIRENGIKWPAILILALLFLTASEVRTQQDCPVCRRPDGKTNSWANVDELTLSRDKVLMPCAPGLEPNVGSNCGGGTTINVSTKATDQEKDILKYNYTVSGGRIVGSGANVAWDLNGVQPGTYTITATVDDGCGFCGKTITKTVTVEQCDCSTRCNSPIVSIDAPTENRIWAGEPVTLTAHSDGNGSLKYNWILTTGTIISGQGTAAITIDTQSSGDLQVTAIVEVSGGCDEPVNSSFTFFVAKPPRVIRPNLQSICPGPGAFPEDAEPVRDDLITELNSAKLSYEDEDYDTALDGLFRILEQNVNNDDDLNPCVLSLIGAIYTNLGNYQKAVSYYQKILPLSIKREQTNRKAAALTNIGLAFTGLKQYRKAGAHFKLGITLYTQIKDNYGLASTLNFYGALLRKLRSYRQAAAIHSRALRIAKSIPAKQLVIDIFEELGRDAMAQNQFSKAIQIFKESLYQYDEAGDPYGKTETLLDLMYALKKNHQPTQAIFFGKQGINSFQKIRLNIRNLSKQIQNDFLRSREPHYRALAEILVAKGRLFEAEKVLSMVKEEENFEFVNRDASESDKLLQRLDLRDDERRALENYDSYKDKLSAIGAEFGEFQQMENEGTVLTAEQQARYKKLEKELEDANTAFQVFLRSLENEFPENTGTASEIEENKALQADLESFGEGVVALYTLVGAERYRVILTTPKIQVDGRSEIKAVALNEKVGKFLKVIQNPKLDPRPLGKELYDIIVKPIESQLKGAKTKTILWSLDGTLRYIPIAALWDGERYFGQKYQNVIISLGSRARLGIRSETDPKTLGFGVSEEKTVTEEDKTTRQFARLDFVEPELQAIIRETPAENGVLAGNRFLNARFTEEALKNNLGKGFKIIHISTHFKLGLNDTSSYLLLGDGQPLTVETIRKSPKLRFNGVDLVTLSACNTSRGLDGNGREIEGLSFVVQQNGAKSIIATLWAVADESTSLLMSKFYRLRKEDPSLTKADALQLAQKAMIEGELKPQTEEGKKRAESFVPGQRSFRYEKDKPFSHPFYWSPFILIGNWK